MGQFHAYPKGPHPSKIGFSIKLPLTNLKINCHELITQSPHLGMKKLLWMLLKDISMSNFREMQSCLKMLQNKGLGGPQQFLNGKV